MPHALGAGEEKEADLGIAEGDRRVRRRRGGVDGAGIGVEPGGYVEGEDEQAAAFRLGLGDGRAGGGDGAPQGPRTPRAEHRVDDHRGGVEGAAQIGGPRLDADVGGAVAQRFEVGIIGGAFAADVDVDARAPVVEVARRDEAVAAVVSRPHEHDDVLAFQIAQGVPRLLGDGQPGVLHQLRRGNATGLAFHFDTAHLVDGDNFHAWGLPLSMTGLLQQMRRRSLSSARG